jgi:uncharacterized membrane protein
VRQKIKAYLIALTVFVVLFFGENLYLRHHPLMTGQDLAIFIFDLDRLLAYILPSYIAAVMIRQQGILVGIITGLLTNSLLFLYVLFFRHFISHEWYWEFFSTAAMGGIGGLLWTLQVLVMRFTRPGEQIK